MNVSWDEVHYNARDLSRKKFIRWIREQPDKISCSRCSNHMRQYIADYPPENEQDLFVWSWRLHNDVNRILGKNEYSYSDFMGRYS